MLTVMFLAVGAMQLGAARLGTHRDAAADALRTATVDEQPLYEGDGELPPIAGVGAKRPGLPNRTHVPRPEEEVAVYAGNKETLPAVTIQGKAGTISPAWTYSGYPVGGQDFADNESWFRQYGSESHTWLESPLRLEPAWTP